MSPLPKMMLLACKPCNIKFDKKEELVDHIKKKHNQSGMDLTASQRILLFPSPGFVEAIGKDTEDESSPDKTPSEEKAKVMVDDLPYDCDNCDRRFTTRSRLRNHMKVHVTQDKSKDERDRSFLQEDEHRREVQCVICDKKFKDQKGYRIHTGRMHAPPPSMACEMCKFKCNTRSGVRKHMVEVHTLKR